MNLFALIYYVCDDYLTRRQAYRDQHLKLSVQAFERGELLYGGALGDPPDRALLIFRAADRKTVESFARQDPYVLQGVVIRWEVQPWHVVIGEQAAEKSP